MLASPNHPGSAYQVPTSSDRTFWLLNSFQAIVLFHSFHSTFRFSDIICLIICLSIAYLSLLEYMLHESSTLLSCSPLYPHCLKQHCIQQAFPQQINVLIDIRLKRISTRQKKSQTQCLLIFFLPKNDNNNKQF